MDAESVYSCIHKSLATLFPPSKASSQTVLCQVLSVVNSCYRGDALQYLLHFLFPAKQLLETLKQEACVSLCTYLFYASPPACWPLCLQERLVVQLCPLDHRLLRSGDFYLLVSPLSPPGARSAPCRSDGARLLLCSVLAGGRHVEQQEVPALALPSLFSMAWLDSVNREREQRGVPPLQRCAVSTQRDVFTLPWEDLVYPQCTSRPRAASKEEVKTETLSPTAKPPPSVKTDQSATSDGDESEGEYVELTERPQPRLSPQKGSLTQSISQLFRTRTHTPTQNSTHKATQPAASKTTHSITQHTAHNTTQPSEHKTSHNATQPSEHKTSHNATQPADLNTLHSATQPTDNDTAHVTQPLVHNNTTQPSEQKTTPSTTQPAAHNITHNTTQPSEHKTTQNDTELFEHKITPSTTQPAAQNTTQKNTQLSEHKTPQNTTQPAAHNANNTTQPAAHNIINNNTQPTDYNTTHTIKPPAQNATQLDAHYTKHTNTQPTDYNAICNNAQPAAHTPECINTHLVREQSDELTHSSVHSAALIHTAVSSCAPEDQSLCCEEQMGGKGLTRGCSTDHREQEDQEKGISQRSLCVVEDELKEEEEEESKSEEKEGVDASEEDNGSERTEEVELEEEVQVTIVPLRQERKDKREQEEEHLKYPYSESTTHCKNTQDSYCETNTFKSVQDIYSETKTICETPQDFYSEEYSENTTSEISYFEIKQQKDTEDSEMLGSCSESDTINLETNTQPKNTQISEKNEENSLCETHLQLPVMESSEKNAKTTFDDVYSENKNQQKLCKNSEICTQQSETVTHCENSPENGCSYFENTALAQPEDSYCESRPPQDSMKVSAAIEEKEQEQITGSEVVGGGAKHLGKGTGLFLLIILLDIPRRSPLLLSSPGSSLHTFCVCDQMLTSNLRTMCQLVPVQQNLQQRRIQTTGFFVDVGVVCVFPAGVRDRGGRPLLTVCSHSSVWSHPLCNSAQLLRLMLYYTSTLGAEVRASGLTVLVDARSAAPCSTLFSALRALQEDSAISIHSVLILTNKESTLRLDKPAATQVEVLTSVRSLQKHVELKQLPADFGGTFNFSQSSWMSFRGRVEQLTNQCEDVIDLLQKAIKALQNTALPAAQFLARNKALMQDVLEDGRLVRLQQEGGAMLSRLRREDGGVNAAEDQRAAVETVSALYEEVDELLHRLVTLSNARTQELSFIVDFKKLEEGFAQVSAWMQEVGEPSLQSLSEPEDSLERLVRRQQMFKEFYSNAYDHCKHGEELLSRMERWSSMPSDDLVAYEVKVKMFGSQLHDFSERVHRTGHNLDRVVQLYRFLDQAYGWALAGMRFLSTVSMEDCTLPDKCQTVIGCLEDFQRQRPPISDARFQEMKAMAGELRGEQGLRHWNFAWSKCQETKRMLDRKMEAALRARDSTHRNRADSVSNRRTMPFRRTLSELWGVQEHPSCSPQKDVESSLDRVDALSFSPSLSICSLASSSRRQQLRKTQSLDCPSTPDVSRYSPSSRAFSEPVRTGNTGVFIKGLEISSTEAADRTLFNRTPSHNWGGKLRHIVQEMVTTEREYVRSLSYIMDQYLPEMERADLPQDLRGKRSVVFGNLEKLLDFHSQFFLRELESCWRHPLRVSHCFLRHQEQFSLYALYSKNKPKSDSLLANHGHSFFRRKQMQLGDKMDLSSYLLKPVQRMSKYALLLSDLMKEVGPSHEAELVPLQEATNMVKFQLRHGNDLLAMDAIRDCDVNLKEQGQLIRQDEFTVCSGRRKCQRRIFLFEELILFSKPKKVDGGLDVFTYKHSFKTADVGLTESTGDSGLQFEIWFRRRTSKNQTFILQASSADVRHAWTRDIAQILWTQANKNKEMRLKEMVSMGVGNKPFLDIQPSDAAISDRAVHYIMKNRGARTRASIAVSVLDHINPFKRGILSSESALSSCSLLGSLNLHILSSSLPAAETSFSSSCIEEDEQEHETSSQPSMTTESSGSSSRCLSGSTGSDSGCVSSHLQEALPEDTNKQLLNSSFISAVSSHTHTHIHKQKLCCHTSYYALHTE
uniref:Rho guanine nucleotide exchange factor 40-like n=1 Tax=Gouania willdenowi TaxID=441366 RepID=A0A8C5EC46_GOUWI